MSSRIRTSLVAALLSLTACDSDPQPKPSAAKPAEAEPAKPAPPTDDEAAALAAKPKQWVAIESLGVSLEVPEGTTISPPRNADDAKRNANLKQGAFVVNVFAVDEFSTPSFAKAKEVYKTDKLVAAIRTEETPTGWIVLREVFSSMYKENRFELNVRTEAGGKKWDCEISASSRPLADLALTACQSLSAGAEPTTTAVPQARAKPPARPAPKKVAAAKPAPASVQGGLPREVIARVVGRGRGKARACYERALRANPKLDVTVTTAFEIGANGNVTKASSTGGDAQLASCVAAVFKKMQFPQPSGGASVRVSYPLHFTPGA